ncbi:unnamed protein product [Psylliodes chrysocephalus]|uniref:Uncharacterized protein n=1 Tax=Psylliodes chrysocephalus TaxID=3402493 RepID=A0A9P0CUS8_9CUCU|nr:unnamed protein product [Psylliodes chrysocephala]
MRGRPIVPFEESNELTKRKKTEDLRKNKSIAELSFATQMSLRVSGNTEASKLLKDITSTSPKRASKYGKAYKTLIEKEPRKMSGEDALALLVDAKLSRHQYSLIRQSNPERFPSYKILQAEKKKCYPNNIKVRPFGNPLLTSKRKEPKKKLKNIPKDALDLLVPPTATEYQCNEDDDDDDSFLTDSDDS